MSRCPVTCSQRPERAETMRGWKVQSALCWPVCGGSRLAQPDQELKTRLCARSHFRGWRGGGGACNMRNASSAAFFRRKCSQLFLTHDTSRLAVFRLVFACFFLGSFFLCSRMFFKTSCFCLTGLSARPAKHTVPYSKYFSFATITYLTIFTFVGEPHHPSVFLYGKTGKKWDGHTQGLFKKIIYFSVI